MMTALSRDTYEGPRGTISKTEDSDSDIEDIGSLLEKDPTKQKGWDDKQKLIKACQEELGTISSGRQPLNIAIIGYHGCGKSSLLNTIFASFSDKKWNEIAKYGSFGGLGKQVTKELISFKKDKYYFRNGENKEEENILMPTFIDMKGFEDQNDEFTQEILKIIFYGKMEEFEDLSAVFEYHKTFGLNGLKEKYGQRKEYLVIDRIIFVCSGDTELPLPTQLMACVSEVAHGVRDIPIFGAMTKADKFDGRKDAKVKKRETEFRKHLGIPDNRFARIANYCKAVDKKMTYMYSVTPTLDVPALKLMTQVFSNKLEVTNPEARPVGTSPDIPGESKAKPVPPGPKVPQLATSGIGFASLLLLITIQVLFMAILLHFCIKPVITEEKLNTICANYDFIKSKHDVTFDGLNELCDHKVDILKPPIYLLGGGIVFVIVVLPIVLYSFLGKSRN